MIVSWMICILTLLAAGVLTSYRRTRPFSLAFWVLASVIVAYLQPSLFAEWLGRPSKAWVAPLIQLAMFGMGATLSWQDFVRVFRMPQAIAIGMLLQFTVMPLAGWTLATLFRLPTELAIGIILIGCCPGGVASNVITYLAKGNVPLSVTMTACSTLAAPLMTPWLMSLLAGRLIEVPFWGMVGEILRIVILPIAGGLAINHGLQRMRWDTRWKEQSLSLLSMIAICLICGIIVADARAAFAGVGLGFLMVIALHNALGYFLGYWGARVCGLPESSCRTIAIEVGMQNGGMGASLATTILHSSTIALASAIFGSWMTVVGSILAVYWSRSPADTGRSSSDQPVEPGLIDKA